MANVKSVIEGKRGCGMRKPGSLYLRSDMPLDTCWKLPLELHTCPVCSEGIKFSRSYRWINPSLLFANAKCRAEADCRKMCMLNDLHLLGFDKALLIWIGDKHYSVESFTAEAKSMGISRKIKAVPRNFILGESFVMLAHIKCFNNNIAGVEISKPGVFSLFKPERIEYVVRGDESDGELDGLELKGYTLVKITKKIENEEPIFEMDDDE